MNVSICIATCDRPEGLARLLTSIAAVDVPAEVDLDVVIADNHPAGSGEPVAMRFAASLPIRYVRETRRGIPFARNAAIAEAADADFICFVDDDQTVDRRWLAELIAVQAGTNADVVTGPAIPRLPDVPAWMAESGAFDLLRFETGAPRPVAYTHNVMTRSAVFAALAPAFDPRFKTSGGSDSHFYRRTHRAGYSIAWADDALTWEWIPAARARVGWLLRRSARIGTTDAFIARDLDGLGALPRTVLLGGRYALRGGLRLVTAIRWGRAGLLRAGQDLARAVGLVGGACGWSCDEYRGR